jgi:hypothetical protein
MDDFGFYAMQLSGVRPPQEDYIDFLEPPARREGSEPMFFWPDPAKGTEAIVRCLDATGGLLVAVTATAPPDRVGYHPRGTADASGFAAMGIVEGAAHGWDILTAHGIEFSVDAAILGRVFNRLWPGARRTDDAWQDFLVATCRTPETRGQKWTWDSSVRKDYGG